MDAFSTRKREDIGLQSILDFSHLSPNVKSHVVKVYGLLAWTVAMSMAGVLCQLAFMTTAVSGWMSFVGAFGILLWLAFDSDKTNYPKRIALISAFGFLEGLSIAPLVGHAIAVDPSIVVTALTTTICVFASFSLSALMSAGKRSWLFLGGALSSTVSVMLMLSLISFVIPSMRSFAFNVNLYGGLVVFLLYVLYDTQMIVARASQGDEDIVWHAIELFIDFIQLFVRILILLLKKKE